MLSGGEHAVYVQPYDPTERTTRIQRTARRSACLQFAGPAGAVGLRHGAGRPDLLALAEGELADTVYALTEANGISCDIAAEESKQLMYELLSSVVRQSQAAISDAAKDNTASLRTVLPLASNIVVFP